MSDAQTTDFAPACICEHGCRNCGNPLPMMSACPAWDPCPIGRENNPACAAHKPLTATEEADRG